MRSWVRLLAGAGAMLSPCRLRRPRLDSPQALHPRPARGRVGRRGLRQGGTVAICGLLLLSVSLVSVTAAAAPAGGESVTTGHSSASASATAAVAQRNDNADFVQVYVNNIENRQEVVDRDADECEESDWKDLLAYMQEREYMPDIFLVQQVSGSKDVKDLRNEMNNTFEGAGYQYVIADGDPGPMDGSPCPEKDKQTNAIIYRTTRFTVEAQKTWPSYSRAGCEENLQARTENVLAVLDDRRADENITVASLHWPSGRAGGHEDGCVEKNLRESDEEIRAASTGSLLRIFGGDLNISDMEGDGDYRPWYSEANGDVDPTGLRYRDAIYDYCRERALLPIEPLVKVCLRSNWTFDHGSGDTRRIDFLFAQARDPRGERLPLLPLTGAAATVSFDAADRADGENPDNPDDEEAKRDYSEHRAILARIHYCNAPIVGTDLCID